MREIKFRAWTGKEHRFPPPLGEWDFEDCEFFAGYNKRPSILEQYTGLHDKSGREIYEGDIVLAEAHIGIAAVEYGKGFRAAFTARGYLIGIIEDCDIEVLGNIHENPELLK